MVRRAVQWALFIPLIFVSARIYGAPFCSDLLLQSGLRKRAVVLKTILSPVPLVERDMSFWRRWFVDRKKRILLRKMDPTALASSRYREWLVNQLVELRIGESRPLLAGFEASASEGRAMARVFLRSVLDNGLSRWAQDNTASPPINTIASLIGDFRNHPAFRFLTAWRLPESTFKLSDRQLALLLEQGLPALLKDSEFISIVEPARNSERYQLLASYGRQVLLAGMILWSSATAFPPILASLEHARSQADLRATQEFMRTADQALHLPGPSHPDDFLLAIAAEQMHEITSEFRKKHGEPDASQRAEIANYVCTREFDEALSMSGVEACRRLPVE